MTVTEVTNPTLRDILAANASSPEGRAFLRFQRRAKPWRGRIELSVKAVRGRSDARYGVIWGGEPVGETIAALCVLAADLGIGPEARELLGLLLSAAVSPEASRILVASAGPTDLKIYVGLGRPSARTYAQYREHVVSLPQHKPNGLARLMLGCSVGRHGTYDRAYLFFRPTSLRGGQQSRWLRTTLGSFGARVARQHFSFALGFKPGSCDMVSLACRPRACDASARVKLIEPIASAMQRKFVPWLPNAERRLTWLGIPFPAHDSEADAPAEVNGYWDVTDLLTARKV